ncbi:alpha-E domain-containing protein [Sphingopyxis macrogoltabida]|uniref:A alpha-helical domain with a conserved ER moti n=1 Tax=Sphingopyxis macrogoltabida TaxID=33050 RepID=A0AAC9FEZ5_SPHMC|nr:alpha-E domain-containing protein [Sphingopyxis macrogoltabida]ALJ11686.1 A alpha-helical domain with a conserved ER moti [Sphingopyxis macrogoltabida]AMU87873.1 A alpha-helical domain with a conserved ER moti [Sphingopyxis macrogoltabida]
MLGKTAASLFWMARYLERSENNARLIDAGFRIALTRSQTAAAEWKSVLVTAGVDRAFVAAHGDYSSARVVDFLLRDPANPSSIASVIKQARDNARTARTALTREVWEAVNTNWMTLTALLKRPVRDDDLPDVLTAIRQQSAQVRGALNGTMLRNDGFNFSLLGTFLERADNTARILDVKYYLLLPSVAHIGSSIDNVQWETILRSVSAHRAYRWLYGAEISALKIAEFLILYRQLPRSLAFCCERMEDNLAQLERGYGEETEAGRMARALCNERLSSPIQAIFDGGLHEYVTAFLRANAALARQIEHDYRFVE